MAFETIDEAPPRARRGSKYVHGAQHRPKQQKGWRKLLNTVDKKLVLPDFLGPKQKDSPREDSPPRSGRSAGGGHGSHHSHHGQHHSYHRGETTTKPAPQQLAIAEVLEGKFFRLQEDLHLMRRDLDYVLDEVRSLKKAQQRASVSATEKILGMFGLRQISEPSHDKPGGWFGVCGPTADDNASHRSPREHSHDAGPARRHEDEMSAVPTEIVDYDAFASQNDLQKMQPYANGFRLPSLGAMLPQTSAPALPDIAGAAQFNRGIPDAAAGMSPHMDPLPPPGWTAQWSRTRGRYYYVNDSTQQSVWDLPNAATHYGGQYFESPMSPPVTTLRSAAAAGAGTGLYNSLSAPDLTTPTYQGTVGRAPVLASTHLPAAPWEAAPGSPSLVRASPVRAQPLSASPFAAAGKAASPSPFGAASHAPPPAPFGDTANRADPRAPFS